MSTRELHWLATPETSAGRRVVAATLRAAGTLLAQWARRLRGPRRLAEAPATVLEFHAEAGAPEGALYVNGRLIGQVIGVNRL